ncbi:DUF1456 family protein [Chitinivorax sp. B]|uniref:DUF1456 family protein n=1 Tax=Chitinivorax sp. B TaxID=2502235 RepID=UPI0010F8B187|nr:DUF1456 family protein [Chitinivorax sp. B]
MNNNDVLRSLRYAMDLADHKIIDMIKAGHGSDLDKATVQAMLKLEDETGFLACNNTQLNAFLDGLILDRRGPSDRNTEPKTTLQRMTHNLILKKLRIAFELKETDLVEIMQLAQFQISKPELNALFRNPGHKNYRACGDQFLRNFLKGLTMRIRGK